jgi:hypothetical protein
MKFDLTKLKIRGVDRWEEPTGKEIILIKWSCEGLGFGELTLVRHPNSQIEVDTEAMSTEFVDKVIEKVQALASDAKQYVDRWALRT